MEILDCTLRDGGYYTNWDFDLDLVVRYAQSMNVVPVDYIEIGYRGGKKSEYFGEYYYCPLETVKIIKEHAPNKKIAIMLDAKNTPVSEIESRLESGREHIDLVRIACAPEKIESGLEQAKKLKELGFTVALNLMYASKLTADSELFNHTKSINKYTDYFYLVDSYGGMYPEQVKEIFKFASQKISIKLGFHGHNNMEMALANSLMAEENGAAIIDSTITGMGRGAGNLKTELLLSSLKSRSLIDFKYSDLTDVTALFSDLCKKYEWGTSYPYMITGGHSLPQAEVMSLLSKRRYSYDTIIRSLLSEGKESKQFSSLNMSKLSFPKKVLVLGGGNTVQKHSDALRKLLAENENIGVIYSSSKSLGILNIKKNQRLMCLQGDEYGKLDKKQFDISLIDKFVYPSDLRLSEYSFNDLDNEKFFTVKTDILDNDIKNSPLSLALETCLTMNVDEVFMAGFDGYESGGVKSKSIHDETQNVLNFYSGKIEKLNFLTPSSYKNISYQPLYSLI